MSSLEDALNELKGVQGNSNSSNSSSEHANELLHIRRSIPYRDKKGKRKSKDIVDVRGRTEIPNPLAMSILDKLSQYIYEGLGVEIKMLGKPIDTSFQEEYRVNMIDKDRQARIEYVNVKVAESSSLKDSEDIIKQIGKQ